MKNLLVGKQLIIIEFLLLLFAAITFSVSATPSATQQTGNRSQDKFSSNPADFPFGVGERLRFHMDFSLVRAGYSEMSIIGIDSTCSEPAWHFRSRVKSTKGVDLVYKVRDVVESWFDLEKLYSHRYERRIREGTYKSRKFFDYDHQSGWVSISNENGPKGLTPFEPFSHNIISALYWVRCQPLEEGKDLHVPLHDLNKQYPITIKVYGLENIKVPAGEFKCWKVEPVLESEGMFRKSGRLWVWLSDDENRIPVLMKSEIPVGSIMGRLVEYRLGKPYTPGIAAPEDSSDDKWDW
ncbi:MAG: DUF3108 domain-containing protein [Candidatus Electryonea clarkiae]|nr:DUF3108 domain-containing protein [Candidatus Electryonea clarkiae]MDP8288732.1 DUF3108 domain-containing protein [Candidatus Electryonea clarkiae]